MDGSNNISSGMLELYVAGALSPEEMAEVSFMVKADPQLLQEVQEIERVMLSFMRVDLNLDQKNNIFSELAGKSVSEDKVAAKGIKVHSSKDHTSIQQNKQTSSGRIGWMKYMVAASVAFLMMSVAGNFYFVSQLQDAQRQIAELQQEKLKLAESNKSFKAKYDRAEGELATVSKVGTKKIELAGQDAAPNAAAVVYWNPENKSVFVDMRSLPKAPKGKVYQLWTLKLDPLTPTDAGLLAYHSDNRYMLEGKNVSGTEAFAITLEPEGGSKSPTLEQLYVLGTL